MASGIALDKMIRQVVRAEVADSKPSETVRDELLARAAEAHQNRLPVQESIPALARGLHEADAESELLSWSEADRCQNENFAGWNLPWQAPGLVYVLVYEEVRRCRLGSAGY